MTRSHHGQHKPRNGPANQRSLHPPYKPRPPLKLPGKIQIKPAPPKKKPSKPQSELDNLRKQLAAWLDADSEHYLCFGGAGDALLLLADCHANPNAKVVFCANEAEFAPRFFELFGVKTLVQARVTMAHSLAAHIYTIMRTLPNFRTSAHLPDGLDINDWVADPCKYQRRMITTTPWKGTLGELTYERPHVVLCPAGSVQEARRQRFLSPEEYRALVARYLQRGFRVYTIGTPAHVQQYGLYPSPDCFWLGLNGVTDSENRLTPGDLRDMLRIVNGATEVVSTDTWLKTYGLLVGVPTKMVLNRFDGRYRMLGTDTSDSIFLNPWIWPALETYRIHELLDEEVQPPDVRMTPMSETFNADYYLRGPETGVSNYTNYRWMPELTLPMAMTLKQFMGVKPGERFLDYGCARGYLVKAMRQLNVEAFGCDISRWAIANCDPDVPAFVGHDFSDDGYDYVFCKDVLEHIPEEVMQELLPRLFAGVKKSALFVVPLASCEGGAYLYPGDEKDATHIHRKTLTGWISMLQAHAKNFVIMGSFHVPVLKMSASEYPGSAGFIYCRKFDIEDIQPRPAQEN